MKSNNHLNEVVTFQHIDLEALEDNINEFIKSLEPNEDVIDIRIIIGFERDYIGYITIHKREQS